MLEFPDRPSGAGPRAADTTGRPARSWFRDLVVLGGLAGAVTVIFAATPLDVVAARLFYRPDQVNHWPLAATFPWSVLYGIAPWVAASLIVIGLAGLAVGVARRRQTWRWYAVFVLASVVLGPGIIVNGVFKDHWNRPRPRDVVEFGGTMHYVAAPLRGEGGASFPCGHCSVGFLCALGWWIWRRRRTWWAAASLAAGVSVGTLLGIARMAAGGHFLSDVVWSALIALGVAHVLYHHVIRIPAREARAAAATEELAPASKWEHAIVALAALGGMAVLLALFAMPHGTKLAATVRFASLPRPPQVLEVSARTANVEVVVVDEPPGQISISGELHGFGLPSSRLKAQTEFVTDPVPTLRYRILQQGWFTDLDGSATVTVPTGSLERVVVRLDKGNIEVTDASRDGVVASGKLRLDLHTKSGRVWQTREPRAL